MSSTLLCTEKSTRHPRLDRIRRKSLALAAGTAAALGVAAAAAPAAFAAQPVNYYVAPNGTDTSGSCTANSPSNAFPTVQDGVACAVAGDVVVLAPTNGTPYPGIGTVSRNITIVGQGARGTVVDVSSGSLTVAAGATVIVSGVSLTYPATANVATFTPNVVNNGSLTLRADMVTGNPYAPGINNVGTSTSPASLFLDSTTVEGNDSQDYISGNGGGIDQVFGVLTAYNSTIADNTALTSGGGIWLNSGTATLINSTIADNQTTGGGTGGLGGPGNKFTLVLSNTLVAGNISSDGSKTAASDCDGVLTDGPGGGNLIGSLNSGVDIGQRCSGLTNGVNGDQVGVASPGVASAAAANGGQTDTVALLAGSPAIAAANAPTCESTAIGDVDQRGDARNSLTRNACDVGAYDTGGN